MFVLLSLEARLRGQFPLLVKSDLYWDQSKHTQFLIWKFHYSRTENSMSDSIAMLENMCWILKRCNFTNRLA